MNKVLKDEVKSLLAQENIDIHVIDAGARNGTMEVPGLAQWVSAYGFEPNPEEFQKLVSGKTDLFVMYGVKAPPYKKLEYVQEALSEVTGKLEFYLTPGAGAAGLKEPDMTRLEEITTKGRSFEENLGKTVFEGYKKFEVPCSRLADFSAKKNWNYIDYLKIDVEGSEYELLQGAGDLLKTTGVIKAEVCFIPFRKNQKLFSDVDLYLRSFGFDLLKYETHPMQVGYKVRKTAQEYMPKKFADTHAQLLQADAIYVNRSLTDPTRRFAQALVLAEKDYWDEAAFILSKIGNQRYDRLIELLRDTQASADLPHRLRAFGYRITDQIVSWGGSVKKMLKV